MAVTFVMNDLPMLATLQLGHEDKEVFWGWVKSHTSMQDLKDVADMMKLGRQTDGTTRLLELSRVGTTIQELAAQEQKVSIRQVVQRAAGDIELVADFETFVP